MKKLFQNKTNIVLAVIMALFFVLSIFGLGNMGMPSSYYQAGGKVDAGYYSAVAYKLDLGEGESVKEIYVNFGGIDFTPMTATVEMKVGTTSSETRQFTDISSKAFTSGKIVNTIEQMKPGQWVRMIKVPASNSTFSYFLIGTDNAVKINEIAFVGEKDGAPVLLKATAVGSGIKGEVLSKEWVTKLSDTDKAFFSDSAKNYANRLIDEQNKFDLNKVKDTGYDIVGELSFYGQEIYVVEGARNVLHGNGTYAEVTSNPLGLFLIGIGGSIFGFNTFGVRIMPLVFTVFNIFLFFYIGKTIFKKDWCALLLALFYAIGGYAIAFATAGLVDAFMLTFIALSFIFSVKFYQKGISDKHKVKTALNVLLSGLFFGLALAVKSVAIFYAIAEILILLFGLIRQFRAYILRKRAVDEEDKLARKEITTKYLKKLGLTFLLIVVGFVLIPSLVMILSFIISGGCYSEYYNTANVLTYMNTHFNKVFMYYNTVPPFTVVSMVNVWGWAVNYGEEVLATNKFIFGNIVLVFLNAFAVIYGLFNLVLTLIESRKTGLSKENKFGFVIPFIFSLVSFLAMWITFMGTNIGTIGAFYPASAFMSILTISVLNNAVSEDKGTLFIIKGKRVSSMKLIVAIVSALAVVAFIMAYAGLVGIPANTGIFSWNVLSPSQFLR